MAYAIVAFPSLADEAKAGSILLKTRRHVADIVVCVGEGDTGVAEIAAMAGARVLETNHGGTKSPLASLLEAVLARNPDILVLGCDDACDPNTIPTVLGPIERDDADVVEAPWAGFNAYSREALEVLRANNGHLEVPPSYKGLEVVRLTKPPVESGLSSETEAAQSILSILGVILLAMGVLLAAVVLIRLLEGTFYLDHALLSIGVIVVGLIVAIAGRRLSTFKGVADEPRP